MQDTETPRTHSLIDRYYEEERELQEKELSLAEVTLRLDANDLAMLGMVARRFRKGRDDVAQEVLSHALIDLFARIESGERKLMARDADESAKAIATSIAEENGIRDVDFRSGYWAQQERQITKLEKQREKLEKKAAKEAAPAEPTPAASNESAEGTVQYPETGAIEKAPAALETQIEAANGPGQENAEETPASVFAD